MRKHKNATKRIVAISSIVMIFVLTVAPLSVSAAYVSTEPAMDFWGTNASMTVRFGDSLMSGQLPFNPSFISTENTSVEVPYAMFQEYIPDALRTEYYDYYSVPGVIIKGIANPIGATYATQGYLYVNFNKSLTLLAGESIEFYVSLFDNTFISNTTTSPPDYVYFNLLSNVRVGSFVGPEFKDSGLICTINRVVTPLGGNISNMALVTLRNSLFGETLTVSAVQFALGESTIQGYRVTPNQRTFGRYTNRIGFMLSPIIKYDYNYEDAVLSDLGAIKDFLGGGSVNVMPDYSDVIDRAQLDIGAIVGEDAAIDQYEDMAEQLDQILGSGDFVKSTRFWQGFYTLFFDANMFPFISLMSILIGCFLVTRAVLGR